MKYFYCNGLRFTVPKVDGQLNEFAQRIMHCCMKPNFLGSSVVENINNSTKTHIPHLTVRYRLKS